MAESGHGLRRPDRRALPPGRHHRAGRGWACVPGAGERRGRHRQDDAGRGGGRAQPLAAGLGDLRRGGERAGVLAVDDGAAGPHRRRRAGARRAAHRAPASTRSPGCCPSAASAGRETAGLADDTEAARLRLFDAVARWLEDAARQAPALVVLDDLQWADPSTLELLQFVARPYRPVPLVVVGAYRHDELGGAAARHLAELGTLGESIRLHGLSQEDVVDLVTDAAGPAVADRWATEVLPADRRPPVPRPPAQPAARRARPRIRGRPRSHRRAGGTQGAAAVTGRQGVRRGGRGRRQRAGPRRPGIGLRHRCGGCRGSSPRRASRPGCWSTVP